MKAKPTCKKCGSLHYGFQACRAQPAGKPVNGPVQWGESMDGFKPFGDSSENFSLLGGSTLVQKDK